jgi:hypothetical protein
MFADRSRRSRRSKIVVNGTTRPTLLYPAEHSAFAKLEATGAGLKFFQHCQAMRALTVGREPCRNVRGMKMLSLKHGDGMAPVAKALEPDTRGGGLNPRHGLCVFCLPSVG